LRAGFQYHLEKPLEVTVLTGVVSILALKIEAGSQVGEASMTKDPSWIDYGSGIDGIHVLVVDDDADLRAQVVGILEECGAQITAVGSAEEALEVVERGHPDALVSGLTMRGRGGYWLIDKVRGLPPTRGGLIPAAALTASTTPENRSRILRAGFQSHIAIPIDPRTLVAIVTILALKE
jgi:CheY-like chemotaxis protein